MNPTGEAPIAVKRYLVTFLFIVVALIVLVLGFVGVVLTTPWGQQFVTRQVNSYLAKKLKTPFQIGRVAYRIPDWIELEDVYFGTPKGDTLLAGKRLRVDLDMLGLLKNRITLNQIELERIRLNVNRTLPDTTFNFQFLIDAFDTGGTPQPADTAAAPLDISLTGITLKDIRAHYVDDVAGADVLVALDSMRAEFDKTDLARSQYRLSTVTVDGLNTKTRIYAGLETPPSPPPAPGDTMDLALGNWKVNRVKWDVQVDDADFKTMGDVKNLRLETDYFYLNGQKVGIRAVELTNSDITATLTKPTKQPAKKTTAPAAGSTVAASADEGWKVVVAKLLLANNRIRFDDQTAPAQRKGLDYAHLDLRDLGISGQAIYYSPTLIKAQLQQGHFQDKSGFAIRRLDANAVYSDSMTSLTGLFVQTNRSLLRDQLVLRYDSLGQLSRPQEAGRVRVQLNLPQNTLAFADILQLAPSLADTPPFDKNPGATLRINARMNGTLAALNIPTFQVAALSGTRFRAQGRLTNLLDVNRLGMDITMQEITTNQRDIKQLAPAGTLPDSIGIPPNLRLTGRLKGVLNNLNIDARLLSSWGKATFKGALAGFMPNSAIQQPAWRRPQELYTGTVTLTELDLGKLLMQPKQFGIVTARASFDGRGLDVKTMQTAFQLAVQEASLNGYRYQNLAAKGKLVAGTLTLDGNLNDPNAQVALDTRVGLKGEYPSIYGTIDIKQLDLKKLKLYTDSLSVQGNLELAMASTNPNLPLGTAVGRNLTVKLQGETYPIDSVYLNAQTENELKKIRVGVPFASVNISGNYAYTQLYDLVAGELNRYFKIPELTYNPIQPPYYANVDLKAFAHPLLQAFVPGLTKLDTVRLNAYIDNRLDTTLLATLKTGQIEYDTTLVQPTTIGLVGANNQLKVAAQVNGVKYGSMNIRKTTLTGTAASNQFNFQLMNKDSIDRDRHGVRGKLSLYNDNYQLRLAENGLLTNYQQWQADTSGYLQYGSKGVYADNFTIRSGKQSLTIDATEEYANAPLRISTRDIDLANLAKVANQDTTLAGGILNGTVVVRDYMNDSLSFYGNLQVDSLKVMEKPLGQLAGRFTNASDRRIGILVSLKGADNDLQVDGFYNPVDENKALDFNVNLQRLDARAIEAFSFGQLRQAKGQVTGQFDVAGSATQPDITGEVKFDSVAFNIAQSNTTYRLDNEQLTFANQTVTLKNFTVRDTLNRTITTNGKVTMQNLPDVGYDLNISAKNFTVLNAARKDNDYVYGNAAITADLAVKGTGSSPSVNGSIRLDGNSRISFVLPDESQAVNEANQTVIFINHKDSLALNKYLLHARPDTAKQTRIAFDKLASSNISVNVEVDEKSQLTVVVDELNGDNLQVRGNARLNVSIDPSGELAVLGRYDVTQGSYSLTYEVLKRQFQIQKGSSIVFTGDPLKADVDITALYQTMANPSGLIASEVSNQQAASDKRKYPFYVNLIMRGNLAKPDLSFDITRPQQDTNGDQTDPIDQKLVQLRENPSEMNKQVFALLVLNSFLSENSSNFFSGSGGGGGVEEVARSSVSKILSDQLDKFASGLVKGVDLNFDLMSTSQFAGSSTGGARTDLNVGLSKSFMNGRLSVAVGRNFVLENNTGISRNPNEVFDNVSLNYSLTRDGRYMLRGYRKNELQTVLEGYIIETGVGFVVTVDYNTLAELLGKNKSTEL